MFKDGSHRGTHRQTEEKGGERCRSSSSRADYNREREIASDVWREEIKKKGSAYSRAHFSAIVGFRVIFNQRVRLWIRVFVDPSAFGVPIGPEPLGLDIAVLVPSKDADLLLPQTRRSK